MSKISREALLEMAVKAGFEVNNEGYYIYIELGHEEIACDINSIDRFDDLILAAREKQAEPVAQDWQTELLDWVSACQSAYYIDSTEAHRFGGLGSNLEDNRAGIVEFVSELLLAAQQAEPVAVATRDTIRTIFMAHGFKIKDGEADLKPYVYEAAEAMLRELSPVVAIPVGYAWVPVEPTREMLDAAKSNLVRDGEIDPMLKNIYRSMLAAAPQPDVNESLTAQSTLTAGEFEALGRGVFGIEYAEIVAAAERGDESAREFCEGLSENLRWTVKQAAKAIRANGDA